MIMSPRNSNICRYGRAESLNPFRASIYSRSS
jgi:hypothetical protein